MGLDNWNMLRIRTERKTKKKFGDPFDLAIDIDDYTIAAYIEENIWRKKYGDIMKRQYILLGKDENVRGEGE